VVDPKADAARLRGSMSDALSSLILKVKPIMDDVAHRGDSAIAGYTEKFEGVRLDSFKVTDDEIEQAYRAITKSQIQAISLIKQRLAATELALLRQLKRIPPVRADGIFIWRTAQPVSSVGCYIPGGKARYPSTAIMCAVPAKIAGVKRIVATSPPRQDGTIDPLTLVAADICGVDEFYKIGGAQAIAALMFGTATIAPVSKIVGPGGMFVTAAKILASSRVSTDMVAGPTELVIYADANANPTLVALDLISQAEHSNDTVCGLVTTSEKLSVQVSNEIDSITKSVSRTDIVRASLRENGFIAICDNEKSGLEFVNEFAPEHLQVVSKRARAIAKKVTSAGLVLLGEFSASSASDYCLGSNHVLPTLGFGKSRASLSVLDFLKVVTVAKASRQGLRKVEPAIKEIAYAEGLLNHYEAIRKRFS
jgi:histidinol dehydrogenase